MPTRTPGKHVTSKESWTKLAEAAKRFGEEKPDLVVCLGDMIDSAPSLDAEKKTLAQVAKNFAPLPGKHHFVVGNHCVETLTKPEFGDCWAGEVLLFVRRRWLAVSACRRRSR